MGRPRYFDKRGGVRQPKWPCAALPFVALPHRQGVNVRESRMTSVQHGPKPHRIRSRATPNFRKNLCGGRPRLSVGGEPVSRLRCSGKSPASEQRIAAPTSAAHTARIPSGRTCSCQARAPSDASPQIASAFRTEARKARKGCRWRLAGSRRTTRRPLDVRLLAGRGRLPASPLRSAPPGRITTHSGYPELYGSACGFHVETAEYVLA